MTKNPFIVINKIVKNNINTKHLAAWETIWRMASLLYPRGGSHGAEHILIVCLNVIDICTKDFVSKETKSIAVTAAALHDIGRFIQAGKNHANVGAVWLRTTCMNIDKIIVRDYWDKVLSSIQLHSAYDQCTQEYHKILWDADKLDSTGYLGLLRMGMRSGELEGTRFLSIDQNVAPLKDELQNKIALFTRAHFFTRQGRVIAKTKVKILTFALQEIEYLHNYFPLS
ncbi:MAG: hypothetical protein COA36_17610 [Desulfotalea sp.]|nr:MAG: hypothetical protein COA36_17610 [Desulfotalea sp.]